MTRPLPLVYVVGDSISLQYGPFLEKYLSGAWRYERKSGEAEALLNLDRPLGANGGDSSMVLDFLRGLLAREDFRPDILLVNCGAHDIKYNLATGTRQVELPQYEANLREIVRLAAGRGIPLAWIRTTHIVDEIHNQPTTELHRRSVDQVAYDAAALRVMAEGGVPVINLGDFTRQLAPDRELFCDHAHFVVPVREKQAAFIAGWLQAWRAR